MKGSRRIKRRLGIGGLGWFVDKPNGWGQQRLRTKRNEAVLGNIKGPPMAKVEDVCGALGVKNDTRRMGRDRLLGTFKYHGN